MLFRSSFVHRIDGRISLQRDSKIPDFKIKLLNRLVADFTIYQSNFSKDIWKKNLNQSLSTVILNSTDPEIGVRFYYTQGGDVFKRYPNDNDTSRMDPEVSRRWRVVIPYSGATAVQAWNTLTLMTTYHNITYTISGTISGSAGGTISLQLVDLSSNTVVDSTSRVGNGSYSFTWSIS